MKNAILALKISVVKSYLPILISAFFAISVGFQITEWIRLPLFIVWVALFAWRLRTVLPQKEILSSTLYSSLALYSVFSIGFLFIYFVLPFTSVATALLIFFLSVVVFVFFDHVPFSLPNFRTLHTRLKVDTSAIVVLSIETVLLIFAFTAKTMEPLVTPWYLYPYIAFLLYGLATFLLVLFHDRYDKISWTVLSVIHLFVTLSVSVLVYGIGFGFDPFIHRAAEMALVQDGFIEPLRILYSGQYALVGGLHFATGLPVAFLDKWHVPVLASILLPIGSYVGLRDGWGVSERIARFGWIAVLVVPFMLLTFSVPFTFTYVQYLLLLFLYPLFAKENWVVRMLLLTFYFVGIFFHPLLLLPAFFLFAHALCRRYMSGVQGIIFTGLLFLFFGTLLPFSLILYQLQQGTAIHAGALLNSYHFSSLFVNIFGSWDGRIHWFYNFIYLLRYWVPIGALMLGMLTLWIKRRSLNSVNTFLLFIGIMFLNIYVVSTLFVFNDIIAHEQKEFALRLLQAVYASGVVGIAVFIGSAFEHSRKMATRVIISVCVAFLLSISWYFSYPQYNAKFAYTSPSVSAHDLHAVQVIDDYAEGGSYVVLSNQMMSAAALQVFGFRDYVSFKGEDVLWYAIPTGGSLYQLYIRSLFQGDMSAVSELKENADIDYLFLVAHTYWPLMSSTAELLDEHAHDKIDVDGKIIIYIFKYE